MIINPSDVLVSTIEEHLSSHSTSPVVRDAQVSPTAPWRPHLYEDRHRRAWHLLTEVPESDSWIRRISATRSLVPELKIGVAGPVEVLATEEILDAVDQLESAVLPVDELDDRFVTGDLYATAADLIYERRMQLGKQFARRILDRWFDRTLNEPDANRKGVLLEVLAAVLFSQVKGFEVSYKGISRRSQQMDIAIHNRNVGGILGGSPLVLGEAKNWTRAVGPAEYIWLLRKLTTSNGRAKLGFFVTTDRYTRGVYTEALRDTSSDALIVLLDEVSFPAVWRSYDTITEGVEGMVLEALQDQQQRLMDREGQ